MVVVERVDDRSSSIGTPVVVAPRFRARAELRALLGAGEWTIGTRHRSAQVEVGELPAASYMRARNTAGAVHWFRVTWWETWVKAMRSPSRVETLRARLLEAVKLDGPEAPACLRALHALAFEELLPAEPSSSGSAS